MDSGMQDFFVELVWSLDVQYYYCVIVVHVVHIMLRAYFIYGTVYI